MRRWGMGEAMPEGIGGQPGRISGSVVPNLEKTVEAGFVDKWPPFGMMRRNGVWGPADKGAHTKTQ